LGWLTGSLAVVALVFVRWMRLLAQLRRTSQPVDESLQRQFDELRGRLGLRRPVRLVVTSDNLGPAAFGWWRGKVLLPQAVAEQSQPSELAAILAHELVHLRRFDPLIGSLQLAVQCVWWFHPAVWWANRQIRVERERACDEEVLAELRCPPPEYARLLVRILSWRQQFVPAVFWSGMRSWDVTSDRLRHVLETTTFHRRAPAWAWLVAAIALVVILPGAGRTIVTASPRDERSTAATPADSAQPGEAPAVSASKVSESSAEDEALRQLDERGLYRGIGKAYGLGEVKMQQMFTLPSSFDPGDMPLPLAPLARILTEVTVGHYFEPPIATEKLRAQIRSLRELPASAKLVVNFAKENVAGLDALVEIPNLSQLSLQCSTEGFSVDWSDTASRPFRLSDLKAIKSLRLWAADADLPEIAATSTLESLILSGDISPEAIDRFAAPVQLKELSLYGYHEGSPHALDLKCLAGMPGLEKLGINGDYAPSDAGASHIGSLSRLRELSFRVDQLSDAGIASIARAGELRLLVLEAGQTSPSLSAAGFAALGSLAKLDSLMFSGKELKTSLRLTDESFAGWNRLTSLRMLIIDSCSIGDAGIRNFAALPILYCLQLEGPLQVTDAGVAELGKAPELAAIVLNGAKVTGPGLAALNASPNLWLLNLTDSPLTDAGLEALASCKRLAQLDVSGSKVSDRGLAAIRGKLPQLSRLNLARTEITDDGLRGFNDRANLQELNVSGTKVSGAEIEKLLDARQELKIWSTDVEKPRTRGDDSVGPFEPIDLTQVIFNPPPDARVPGAANSAATEKATAVAAADERADDDSRLEPGELQDLIHHLQQLGLRINTFGIADNPTYAVEFTAKFVDSSEPLPIDQLPNLWSITISNRANLSNAQLVARLQAVRNLPAETHLFLTLRPDQTAVMEELARIPKLERVMLSVMTEKIEPGPPLRLNLLKQLKKLQLSGEINPAVTSELQSLVKLEELVIYNHPVLPSTDLAFLSALTRLKKLTVSNLDLRDAAFERIAGLQNLEDLSVELNIATDQGLKHLANAKSLKRVYLKIDQTKFAITPAGLAELARLEQLESLMATHLPAFAGRDGPINDAAVIPWASKLKRLKELQLFNAKLGNESLVAIGQLESLEVLRLMGNQTAEATGLKAIGDLPQMRELSLWIQGWDGKGLEHLAKLPKLEQLALSHSKLLDDAALAPLVALTGLKSLELNGASIEGHGLAPFTTLKRLESLALSDNPIDDAGAAAVARLTSIQQLDLSNTQLTDEGLRTLAADLPGLTNLTLNGTKVTDGGLDALMRLQHLKQVFAARTAITKAGRKDRPWSVVLGEPTYTIKID
jgi:beta-lactamase regulating signal transducer with metallopeptidase domain/Leucine-rich repeat (LRR) protein